MESTGQLRPVSATKAQSGSGGIPPQYLKWTLEGGGGQPHAPAALLPRRDPVPVGGGWVSARVGLDGYCRREKSCSHRKSNPAPSRLYKVGTKVNCLRKLYPKAEGSVGY
jgi:hypothetical protein